MRKHITSKVVSCVISASLALTLNPITALADEVADQNAIALAELSKNSEDAAANIPANVVLNADTEDATGLLNTTMPLAMNGEGGTDSNNSNNIAPTAVQFKGLNFVVDTANNEATLVGWGIEPSSTLDIPANVSLNGSDYPVTRIKLGGGGSVLS